MPIAPYARVRASLNAGALQTGGIIASGGQTVQLSADPAGLAGATQYRWEILSFPPTFTVPSGWSTDANGKYYSTAQTPPIFTLRTNSEWGKYLFRLTLNGGGPALTGKETAAQRTAIAALVDVATGISVASSTGLVDMGAFESTQFSGDGWAGDHRANLRVLATGFGGGGGGGLVVTGSPSTGDGVRWTGSAAVWGNSTAYAITAFAATAPIVETGITVANPAFTAVHNQTPTALLLTNNADAESKNVQATPTSFASSHSFAFATPGTTRTFTLTGTNLTSDARNASIVAGQKIYYGNKVPGTFNAAFITGLPSNALQTSGNKTFTSSAGGTEHKYFAFPTRLGSATVVIGGFTYSWTVKSTTISVTNAQAYAENYTLIENENLGVGSESITVTVS